MFRALCSPSSYSRGHSASTETILTVNSPLGLWAAVQRLLNYKALQHCWKQIYLFILFYLINHQALYENYMYDNFWLHFTIRLI